MRVEIHTRRWISFPLSRSHTLCHTLCQYDGWSHYEMFQLWLLIFFRARFCGMYGFLMSMGPFLLLCAIIAATQLTGLR